MEFYETEAGRRFFQGQLPQLIAALQDVAKSLAQPTRACSSSQGIPPTFLQELYYGNFDPSAAPNGPEHIALTQQIKEYQNQLCSDVTPELWDRIDGYRTLLDDRGAVERVQAFESGYRCAFQLIAAGLSHPTLGELEAGA